ncbi:MAG: ABC transporter permease [Bryobacteraceae bacterium]
MWGRNHWNILAQDLRHAVRRLRRSPGFTFTAILTLALGIGSSTAIFTIVDTTVLKPLSYRDSGSLVALWERVRFLAFEPTGPNPRHVDVWRKRAASFSGVTLLRQGAIGLTTGGSDHPQLVGTVMTLPNLFEVLQATPLLGRGFIPEDGVEGRDKVAILTYNLWQGLFHGDPNIVGKSIRLGDVPREVIGVLPKSFHFPNRNALRSFQSKQPLSSVPEPSVFVPAAVDLSQFSWNGEYGNWIALARLKPGVAVKEAQAELNLIETQIVQEMPANQRDSRPGSLQAFVQPMQEAVVGNSETGLWLLMAAVLGLMLIACMNLASAQLARTLSRQREASVRTALGAPMWRLLRSSLTENLLLAAAGGAAGVFLASEGLDVFRRYSLVDLPRLSEVQLNNTVLFFSLALIVGSTVLFSILPALSLLRTDPQGFLQQGTSRAVGNRIGRRFHSWLIGFQVFGCTALLLVTGLFSKNLLSLMYQEKGFETEQVAFAQVNLSGQTHGPAHSRIAFIDSVLESLRGIPGAQAAGLVSAMPLEGESWIESLRRVDQPNKEGPLINLRWVSPGYFETMRHRLVAGRFFEERDRNLNSVVLSEGEAKSLWQNENPIGGMITTQGRQFTVIGVVADSRTASLKSPPSKIAYLHYKDRTPGILFFMMRGAQSANTLVASMREAIWKLTPQVTIARVKTLDAQVSESLAAERFQTFVLMTFGTSALLLAMLGIHGMLSYSVAARKQEIGVRMALGATRGRIYWHTFSEAGPPVLAGLVAGLIASLLASRAIRQVLYGAQGVDPPVVLIVATIFLAAAVIAAFLPARRAASVDPMESLRSD